MATMMRTPLAAEAVASMSKKLKFAMKTFEELGVSVEIRRADNPATAHDVFMAMQEIPYILKTEHTPESKLLTIEENMARALVLRWSDYDRARGVS